jgi:uncharacterized protein (TIGR03000 family)
MNRPSWKNVMFGVVMVAALVAVTDQANAWWGCCQPAYYSCFSPCYTCWDPCCGSDEWYLGCRSGPIRRLLFGPYRWYYGGSCYSGCYSSCYAVDCCGAAVEGSVEGTTATPATPQPTPAKKPVLEAPKPLGSEAPKPVELPPAGVSKELGTPLPSVPSDIPLPPLTNPPALDPTTPAVPELPKSSTSATPENSGVISVWVPFDAKVTVNGLTTKSTGSRRQFVSYGLKPGFSYKYEIHAEVVSKGQIVEENKTVFLTMGQDTSVVFDLKEKNPVANIASTR